MVVSKTAKYKAERRNKITRRSQNCRRLLLVVMMMMMWLFVVGDDAGALAQALRSGLCRDCHDHRGHRRTRHGHLHDRRLVHRFPDRQRRNSTIDRPGRRTLGP